MIRDLIYDVGMHNGDDTAYYLHRGFRVVAVDANPQMCAHAAQRFAAEIAAGRLTILNVGVAAEAGACDFWVCETHSEWSSFDRGIASRDGAPHHGLPVPCRTFDQILAQHGIPFCLKVDIEGHDLLCLDALRGQRDLPVYISTEISRFDDALQKLVELGYTGYKCVSQYTFVPLEWPARREQRRAEFWYHLLERRNLPLRLLRRAIGRPGRAWLAHQYTCARREPGWTFPPGSSGPFGESALGAWLDADHVRDTYHHYRTLFKQGAFGAFWRGTPYSFWLDLHARREE